MQQAHYPTWGQTACLHPSGVIFLGVWDEIEDIRSQIFDCDSWPPTVMDRSQEIFLLLVYGSIHTLLWREIVDHQAVFNLAIGFHITLHHGGTHINAETEALTKYQSIMWKYNTLSQTLTKSHKANSQNGVMSAVSPKMTILGTRPSSW